MKQISIVALLLLAPLALAHGAADNYSHEIRLTHDDNDDALLYSAQSQGVIDNIAVNVREGYSFVYGEPLIIFKLYLNNACNQVVEGNEVPYANECGTVTETIQFTANGSAHEMTVQTEDKGATWTGSVDYLTQPVDILDGERFTIEVGSRFSLFGLEAGSKISDIFVKSTADGNDADSMPQGLIADAPEAFVPTMTLRYDIGEYTVRAPDYYAELALDSEVAETSLEPDAMIMRTLTIKNPLSIDQSYTVIVTGTNGLHASVSDGATSGSAVSFALQAGNETTVELGAHNMAVEAGMSQWTIVVASPVGGYNTLSYMLNLEAASCPGESHDHESMDEMEGMQAESGMDSMEHTTKDCDENPVEHTDEEHTDEEEHNSDGHQHDEETKETEETPGFSFLALVAALGAVLVARRK
jgi:hypothetical protein